MAKQVERKKQEDTHNSADKYKDILGSTAVNTGDTAKVADAVTAIRIRPLPLLMRVRSI